MRIFWQAFSLYVAGMSLASMITTEIEGHATWRSIFAFAAACIIATLAWSKED